MRQDQTAPNVIHLTDEYRLSHWQFTTNGFDTYARKMPTVLGEGGSLYRMAAQRLPPAQLHVLTWGCGEGVCIRQMVERFEGKVAGYGCSREPHPQWRGASNINFVRGEAVPIAQYYFSSGIRFDLIVSNLGIENLGLCGGAEYVVRYLIPLCRPGAEIAYTTENSQAVADQIRDLSAQQIASSTPLAVNLHSVTGWNGYVSIALKE